MPGSSPVRSARSTRCARATDANCRMWPWVNSRRNWPNVAPAYTPPNSRFIPPERITSRSSMLSAPAAIPAMIEVSFPPGSTAADLTRVASIATWLVTSSDKPGPLGQRHHRHQTRVRHEILVIEQRRGRDQPCGNFTTGAFSDRVNQDLDTPDSLDPEGTFAINAPDNDPPGPRIEA